MFGWSLAIELVIETWRSVAILLIMISFPSSSCMQLVKSFFLRSTKRSDLSDLNHLKRHYIINVLIHQVVSAILWRMTWTVTTTITIKINHSPGSENLSLPPTFNHPCLVNNKEQWFFLCVAENWRLKHDANWLIAVKVLPANTIAADKNRFLWGFRFTTGCESHFILWLPLEVNSTDSMQPTVFMINYYIWGTFSAIYL